MKFTKQILLSAILITALSFHGKAQLASSSETKVIAANFIKSNDKNILVKDCVYVISSGKTLAYVYSLSPQGFIIIAADKRLSPVYAWSSESDFNAFEKNTLSAIKIFSFDLESRIKCADAASASDKKKINDTWNILAIESDQIAAKAAWMLTTNWTQSAPYNAMCPMDLNAGSRSIAGCPAIAMGQIVNYNKKLNGTQFTNLDDYYHSYGAGNQYWIDNDWSTRGFPNFDSLNVYLDSITNRFSNSQNLNNAQMAALCFACGVAATQVYTASGSGTFGVDQAFDAYQRFGFAASKLVYPTDTSIVTQIRNNMLSFLPVHLALVDSPVTVGHNVVVDGYNSSTDLYHFNFGWGGSNNGWYSLPPTTIAYNLTVIEGAVVDINLESVSTNQNTKEKNDLILFPNPVSDNISFTLPVEHANCVIRDIKGSILYQSSYSGFGNFISINTKKLHSGIYSLTLYSKNYHCIKKFIVSR
ncbi:MAG: C10 family peptidase [Bacteroidota bacterium]